MNEGDRQKRLLAFHNYMEHEHGKVNPGDEDDLWLAACEYMASKNANGREVELLELEAVELTKIIGRPSQNEIQLQQKLDEAVRERDGLLKKISHYEWLFSTDQIKELDKCRAGIRVAIEQIKELAFAHIVPGRDRAFYERLEISIADLEDIIAEPAKEK